MKKKASVVEAAVQSWIWTWMGKMMVKSEKIGRNWRWGLEVVVSKVEERAWCSSVKIVQRQAQYHHGVDVDVGEGEADGYHQEYRHPSCLVKHRWEHSPHWKEPTQLSMSKHQQVQMLEVSGYEA